MQILWHKLNKATVFIVVISIELIVKYKLNEDPLQVTVMIGTVKSLI